jgi:hypothetical protein
MWGDGKLEVTVDQLLSSLRDCWVVEAMEHQCASQEVKSQLQAHQHHRNQRRR